jgi:hypothetical protein
LLGVILGLLVVGLVSGTLVRHVIQIVPAVAALILVIRRVPWALYAALSVFVVWLLVMVAIWLYLLGVARIITGRFSTAEIALTLVIGASCVFGLAQVIRAQSTSSRAIRAAAAITFAGLQIGALWLSLQPAIASI